jgi:hypothetical protein
MRAFASWRETPRKRNGSQTFENTVLHGISVGSWNTNPSSGRPSRHSMAPRVGADSPASIRSTVDLPHPDGPSSDRNSPSRTSRSSPATATTLLPNTLWTSGEPKGGEADSASEDIERFPSSSGAGGGARAVWPGEAAGAPSASAAHDMGMRTRGPNPLARSGAGRSAAALSTPSRHLGRSSSPTPLSTNFSV